MLNEAAAFAGFYHGDETGCGSAAFDPKRAKHRRAKPNITLKLANLKAKFVIVLSDTKQPNAMYRDLLVGNRCQNLCTNSTLNLTRLT